MIAPLALRLSRVLPLRHLALRDGIVEAALMGINPSFLTRMSSNRLRRYSLAIAAVAVAFLVNSALHPLVGDRAGYVLLFPAVAFSAWYCGIGPSIVATLLALVGSTYGFVPAIQPFHVFTVAEVVRALVFLASCAAIVALGELRRRENERLRSQQGELERRVQERTADLDTANGNLRELSARLLQLQDDERRRIARELHDSVGQTLAALAMNLSAVRLDVERLTKTAHTLTDSENLVREMSSEVRTISHLLHPPLLDEAGLVSALRWYVEGFAVRSKINVELDLPENFGRLPRESETAIFRVVQECLTNIHRHSESPIAKIRLRQRDHEVLVEIADKGKGIPPEKKEAMATSGTPGVGIRGMRERLRQLGGALEINSNGTGTVVTARLPIPEASSTTKAAPVPLIRSGVTTTDQCVLSLQLAHLAAISQSHRDHFPCTHNSSTESPRVHCCFCPTAPESGQQISWSAAPGGSYEKHKIHGRGCIRIVRPAHFGFRPDGGHPGNRPLRLHRRKADAGGGRLPRHHQRSVTAAGGPRRWTRRCYRIHQLHRWRAQPGPDSPAGLSSLWESPLPLGSMDWRSKSWATSCSRRRQNWSMRGQRSRSRRSCWRRGCRTSRQQPRTN